MLNEYEKKKYDTISKLVSNEINLNEAKRLLNLQDSQIYRLKKIFKNEGEKGFIHKNRYKANPNKKDSKLIKELETLYLDDYYDYNFEQFYEKVVVNNYSISYDVMLKYFTKDDIISPLAHKNTIKNYDENMKRVINNNSDYSDLNNEKIELYKSRLIEIERAHIRRANNLFVFGQEVQMDACQKLWFGGISSYLHLAVDKATKKVLFGWFEFEEITRGYFVLLFHIIINYGIPQKIKADNRSSFSANNAKNKDKKLFITQFGRICEELNINLETTSIATAKANVERENGTFKNRLIAELRHEKITTIDEANEYLNNKFIPYMNKKFSYKIDEKTSVMKLNNYSEEELKLIISEKYTRIIDNASAISYSNKYYIPINIATGEVTSFIKGTKCIFIVNYDGEFYSEIENHYYKMIELENRDTIMTKESENNKIEKEHHKYIPPKDHPWRKNMMLRHKIN